MILADFHCDTISGMKYHNKELYSNDMHIDLKRMSDMRASLQGPERGFLQVFALYCGKSFPKTTLVKNLYNYMDCYHDSIRINERYIKHCNTYSDIESALGEGRIASVLGIEGGDVLFGETAALRVVHRLGVRLLTLTHWYNNEISGSCTSRNKPGLTETGKNMVREMNTLGMAVDCSHQSERGFWDVIEVSSKPITASHSNAKKLCSHVRNLTDEQIVALAKQGGVIGINFLPNFLNNSAKANLCDITRHIEHIAGLGGIDCVGFGSDFDGVDSLPEGIRGVQDFGVILNELSRLNYSQSDIDKIAGMNFTRFLKIVLPQVIPTPHLRGLSS